MLSIGVAVIFAFAQAGCDRESSDWTKTVTRNTPDAYDGYRSAHPAGPHANEASARAEQLREEADWNHLPRPPSPGDVENFLKRHANGSHASAAADLLAQARRAEDVARYVSSWDVGVSIPENAPRYPETAFAIKALPFRTVTIALSGTSLDALLQVAGEGCFASDGRLARGTDAFKPIAISLASGNGPWSPIKAITISNGGFLVVTDSKARAYEVHFGASLNGSIDPLSNSTATTVPSADERSR